MVTVVGTASKVLTYQVTLPEGTYYVTATKGSTTHGPVPVMHDEDPEVVPAFSF